LPFSAAKALEDQGGFLAALILKRLGR